MATPAVQRTKPTEMDAAIQLIETMEREARRVVPGFKLSTAGGEIDAVVGKFGEKGSRAARATVLDILYRRKYVTFPEVYDIYARYTRKAGAAEGEKLLSELGKINPNAALTLALVQARGKGALGQPLPIERYAMGFLEEPDGYAKTIQFLRGRGLERAAPVLREMREGGPARQQVEFQTERGTVIVRAEPSLIDALLKAQKTGENKDAVHAAITYGAYEIVRRRKTGEKRETIAAENVMARGEIAERLFQSTVAVRRMKKETLQLAKGEESGGQG